MPKNAYHPDMASICRSVVINGRRTSIRMEREFWIALDALRQERGLNMKDLLTMVTEGQKNSNRTSVIKTWVLAQYRQTSLDTQ